MPEPAFSTMALVPLLVVVIASVRSILPDTTEMLTVPVALTPVGLTVPIVRLPAFTYVRFPMFWAASVVTLLLVFVSVALPPNSARPVVVIVPTVAFCVMLPLFALSLITPLEFAVSAALTATLPPYTSMLPLALRLLLIVRLPVLPVLPNTSPDMVWLLALSPKKLLLNACPNEPVPLTP